MLCFWLKPACVWRGPMFDQNLMWIFYLNVYHVSLWKCVLGKYVLCKREVVLLTDLTWTYWMAAPSPGVHLSTIFLKMLTLTLLSTGFSNQGKTFFLLMLCGNFFLLFSCLLFEQSEYWKREAGMPLCCWLHTWFWSRRKLSICQHTYFLFGGGGVKLMSAIRGVSNCFYLYFVRLQIALSHMPY